MLVSKKRLIFFISSSIAGGAQIYLINLIKGLKNDFDILVVMKDGFLADRVKNECDVDYSIMEIGFFSRNKIQSLIENEIIKYGHIYVNAHLLGTAYYVSRAIKKNTSVTFVATIHNKIIYENISLLKRLLFPVFIKKIISKADAFITVSEEISKSLKKYNSEKPIIYIPSSVPMPENKQSGRKGVSKARSIKVAFIGRISKQKNPLFFIEFAKRISELNKSVSFYIYGDGEMKNIVEEYAGKLFSNNSPIHFCGFTNNPIEVMQNVDVLTLTSDYEGTPMVILEALSVGLPIISTDVGGIPYVLKNEQNGILVKKRDMDSYVESFCRLISDDALYANISTNAIDTISKQFNFNNNLTKYKEVITGRYE